MNDPIEGKSAGQRRPAMEFWPRIHRKQIAAHINGQPMIQGELVAFSTYEIVIKTKTGREVLIPKGAITSVDLPDGWRALPASGIQEGAGND